MRLPGSPWFYNEAELACFVEKEMDKHEDELCKLYRNDKDAFAKKIRGITIGTWQKKWCIRPRNKSKNGQHN